MPVDAQTQFWNEWNKGREARLTDVSLEQASWIEANLAGRSGLSILDVGCGAGWLCGYLQRFGSVTGTDLAGAVLERAVARLPQVRFVPGDFMALDFELVDVVTCLEVLSHVADQPAFVAKLASHLKPGGELLLATQNRRVLERNDVPPPGEGQIRRWVDRQELRRLLAPHFTLLEITTLTPRGHGGLLRVVNSNKLTGLADAMLGAARVKRLKERLGFGWTIVVRARLS